MEGIYSRVGARSLFNMSDYTNTVTVEITSDDSLVADVIVVPVASGAVPRLPEDSKFRAYEDILQKLGVTGSKDELTRIPLDGSKHVVLAFIGVGKAFSATELMFAAGSAVRQIGARCIQIDFSVTQKDKLSAIVEGAFLGAYRFDKYRSKKSECPEVIRVSHNINGITDSECRQIIARAKVIAGSVGLAKDLVNTTGDDLYPAQFASFVAKDLEGIDHISVESWDEKRLQEKSCGGILGVGRGSNFPPRLVKISYTPGQYKKHLSLVGKGITFDTGGLSLKPASAMLGMKYDMTGAANVFAVLRIVALLRLSVRVTGWLCLAENMLSGSAIRPGDILRTYSGKTVEVTNTDAEGRLVLADGLALAGDERPDVIIDIATLTGAAKVALGESCSGLMGNNPDLLCSLEVAAKSVGEKFLAVPIDDDALQKALKSDIADIVNVPTSNKVPGMQFGAVFLKEFETTNDSGEAIPWAHLDVAGPANASYDTGFNSCGPTGVAVRSLVEFCRCLSSAPERKLF
ncbi:leucyl aminopeptidase [Tropheryma whipplei]|uniref:leucyl aminopeptidase n=1 Tax=Tropheryma whipplei TaxID=2039 RepID=UPI001EEE01C0|nr:leucyl aminopeptidase [Tropheryma whipplei]